MNTEHFTTPSRRGQGLPAPNNSKYAFDPARIVIFDAEVFPGPRWCVGFLNPDGTRHLVDGSRVQLAEALDGIAAAGFTLIGYNSNSYDIPILRAVLGNEDPYPVSHTLVHHDGPGLPPELRDRAERWPVIRVDHIDLSARTRQAGHFPSLKSVGANLGCPQIEELPYPPDRELTAAEWEEVKAYNRGDLDLTRAAISHFGPELEALAALSNRYGLDLRSTHPAGIASAILCAAYRAKHGRDPIRVAPPAAVCYRPPGCVRRPRNPIAAEWFDRLCGEEFPMGGETPKPTIPEPDGLIIVGGVTLTVGSGGLHSVDHPALYRYGEWQIYEADVRSYYPNIMAQFGIFPLRPRDDGNGAIQGDPDRETRPQGAGRRDYR